MNAPSSDRRFCRKCGNWQNGDKFGERKLKDGRVLPHKSCGLCRSKVRRFRNGPVRFAWDLRKLYNMSVEDWARLFEAQGGRCAICRARLDHTKRGINVDHCHNTGTVRGLLCGKCNSAIGYLGDNYENACRAVAYLEKHKARE